MSDYLPHDVVVEIMKKLPVKSLMQFRTVSKLWKSSIDDQQFMLAYGVRKSNTTSFVVNHTVGFHAFIGSVNYHLNYTPINTDLVMSVLSPVATSDGVWCFTFADSLLVVLFNPSIMRSFGVFIPYYLAEIDNGTVDIGFGVRPDNLDPHIIKISYPCSGFGCWFVTVYTVSTDTWVPLVNTPAADVKIKQVGQAVIGNFIYWVVSVFADEEMHTPYEILSFNMVSHVFSRINLPEVVIPWLLSPFFLSQHQNKLVISANYLVGVGRELCGWLLGVNGVSVTSYSMFLSVITPHFSKLVGFNNNEEAIVEVDPLGYQYDSTLHVCDPAQGVFHNTGVDADIGSFFTGQMKESLILAEQDNRALRLIMPAIFNN